LANKKIYLRLESEKKCEEVNIKCSIFINVQIRDTYLTHRTYKILKSRMEGIQSRAQDPACRRQAGLLAWMRGELVRLSRQTKRHVREADKGLG
jgi:hypothetical protein